MISKSNLFYLLTFIILFACGTKNSDQKVDESLILSKKELQDKSLEELRILRNEIFARKGLKFKSQDLQKHFSGTDWYNPKYENVDSLLSENDLKNIQAIIELEKLKRTELDKRKIIGISENELIKYQSAFELGDNWTKEFISKLIWTIEEFKDRPADTTILVIGNIDGIGYRDTIVSSVFALDGTIYVRSNWSRSDEIIWSEELINPFLGINPDELFGYELRHPWVTFTVAVHYSIPELSKRSDYDQINRETALLMANWYIDSKNIDITEQEYEKYFDLFNGQLFVSGEPEGRHELLQWYEPKKQFILYYSP